MTDAELKSIIFTLVSQGTNDWNDQIIDEVNNEQLYSSGELKELSKQASYLSEQLAVISEYLDWRGGGGCGDHGHDDALKKAEKRRKKVRKALGYTYP
jgi:hypothetical protein